MDTKLSIDHSLYMIDEQLLKEFNYFRIFYTQVKPQYNITHTKIDTWAATFNNWLLLISHEEQLIIDFSKTFTHSFNIVCLDEIEKSEEYYKLLNRFSRKEFFIAACYITNYMHNWKRDLMEENGLEDLLNRHLHTTNYFRLSDDEVIVDGKLAEEQAKLVKVLMKEVRQNNSFNKCLEQAIFDTQAYLRYCRKMSNSVTEEVYDDQYELNYGKLVSY